ncbi:hypothetical protein WMY93_028216 [Mugilogobius chulae]|uniref:Uncharacterized protein n=1 Tax=Mugilogobius chulae TaxID=88201 RepID=A0AAW0MSB6_9GOBI
MLVLVGTLRPPQRGPRSPKEPSVPEEPSVPQERLAVAVAASVLITFVVGFSAGALSRSRVLRCLRAVLRKDPPRRPDPPCQDPPCQDPRSEIVLSSVTPENTAPPVKPRRSYRLNPPAEPAAVYLESCDRTDQSGAGPSEHDATAPTREEGRGKEEETERGPEQRREQVQGTQVRWGQV